MSLAERDILRGYAVELHAVDPTERSEACACGGVITVVVQSPVVIMRAVQMHQETARHQAWRFRQEAHLDEQQPATHPCTCHR